MATIDIDQDIASLTAALVDVYSESGHETELTDAVEGALRGIEHLSVDRDGDAVVARTSWGRAERVVLAGHLDTVPPADNLPSTRDGDTLRGLGAADMKGGIAVMLRLAASVTASARDISYVFYDGEEVEAERNGLLRLTRSHPDWLAADFAVLLEPTDAIVEGGCQGTMRVEVVVPGVRAHSARSWMGVNAVHEAGAVIDRLRAYDARRPVIDGLEFREGLNAVGISGGVAGNVVPGECVVTINYRFAPDRSEADAEQHLRQLFSEYAVTVTDSSPGAGPGLQHPAARAFATAIGGTPRAKFGWTDVARFSALGVPAVNYGPGDPQVAHTAGEWVSAAQLTECEERLSSWLTP
ncbi:MAG: succinyl-diaminopimelate desuccinylase [Actinomycetia bacterium]|nr:succinyl-diaminopimelate desuccinylase [Actinomycetes bacterium]